MVKRGPLSGMTVAEQSEVRMWVSCCGLVLLVMFIMSPAVTGFLDYFRLVFFASPFWLTLLVGPFQTDRSRSKLILYACGVFLLCWFTVHAYPSQCRHAWGTMMVSDTAFYDNKTETASAILQEKDTYYRVKAVSPREYGIFWPKRPNPDGIDDPFPNAHNNVEKALEIVRGDSINPEDGAPKDEKRVKKWIEAWTGGMSLEILALRAYCNVNQASEKIPHVYPFRVLGILPNQISWTMPCPYWSCLMTEARPKGKLIFFTAVGLAGMLNYLHYRCNCECCSRLAWMIGAGQPRLWWWWFWAALLPLCLVMGIKTTCDEELGVVIGHLFQSTVGAAWDFTLGDESTTEHKVQAVLIITGIVLLWYYRAKIRHELGLDEHFFIPFMLTRNELAEEAKHTFQICIWRVDVSGEMAAGAGGEDGAASPVARRSSASSPLVGRNGPEEVESVEEGQSSRSLAMAQNPGLCGSPAARSPASRSWLGMAAWALPGYAPMFNKGAKNRLTTADGRIPSLSVHIYYGMEEVQSTRVVKPSQSQWWNCEPVYFQENFKVTVEWRPQTCLRVEVRDASASLGAISIGSVSFDELALEHEFISARNDNPQVRKHSVPIMQVVQMSAPPPKSGAAQDIQVSQMRGVGFKQHKLTDGGGVWLAFYEHEDHDPGIVTGCC